MVSSDHIAPGGEGTIKAVVQTDNERGIITKTVQVRTNSPERPLVILRLRARVIDNYHSGVMRAEEIFRSPCRGCHVERGIGRLGADLFRADCLMCHRVGMIGPSITALRKIPDDRLKKGIENGVADSMMPGFSFKVGGPLTNAQIRSLVDYIKKKD